MRRMTVGELRERLAHFDDALPIRAEAVCGGCEALIGEMRVVDGELEIDVN